MSKYIIGEVLDNGTQQRSERWGYKVGKVCTIDDSSVQIGTHLVVKYPEKSAYFRTGLIVDFEQTDYGVWITTENITYRFDNER